VHLWAWAPNGNAFSSFQCLFVLLAPGPPMISVGLASGIAGILDKCWSFEAWSVIWALWSPLNWSVQTKAWLPCFVIFNWMPHASMVAPSSSPCRHPCHTLIAICTVPLLPIHHLCRTLIADSPSMPRPHCQFTIHAMSSSPSALHPHCHLHHTLIVSLNAPKWPTFNLWIDNSLSPTPAHLGCLIALALVLVARLAPSATFKFISSQPHLRTWRVLSYQYNIHSCQDLAVLWCAGKGRFTGPLVSGGICWG
jgi:hypothetical protein